MKVSGNPLLALGVPKRMLQRSTLCAGLASLTLLLGACGPDVAFYTGVASIASFGETGKGLVDHAVSYQTGEDCSLVHVDERRDYCVDHNAEDQLALTPPPSYCYQTLGSVECFTRPDPRRDTPALGTGALAAR